MTDRIRYPLATIAAYGPTNQRATKVVVSVLPTRAARTPTVSRIWTTDTTDARHDPTVVVEIAFFLREHKVRQSVTGDRILGCPHEEGIDYPMARPCPVCPFWEDLDRFTHEPLAPPTATMSPEETLAELAKEHARQPHAALSSADAHRSVLIAPLVALIDKVVGTPDDASDDECALFSYALYLLAKWREPRAYPGVVRWLSLPEDVAVDLSGDVLTQDGARMLAAVCDGNLEPIKTLILNREADEYGRGAGVGALALLAAWAEMPRQPVMDYFLWLVREGLERDSNFTWDILAMHCADIEALPVFPDLRRAYDAGLVDPLFMEMECLDEVEAAPRGQIIGAFREQQPPITDVAAATSWWAQFSDDPDPEWSPEEEEDDEEEEEEVVEPQQPYRAPQEVGRNEPCPCGSAKKYKKCCGLRPN